MGHCVCVITYIYIINISLSIHLSIHLFISLLGIPSLPVVNNVTGGSGVPSALVSND